MIGRSVLALILLMPFGGCFYSEYRFANRIDYNTAGEFVIQCKQAWTGKKALPQNDQVSVAMNETKLKICGQTAPTGVLRTTSSRDLIGRKRFEAEYEFACEPTEEVMANAMSFEIIPFCGSLFKQDGP